ncbi:MAG: hypothetical protein GY772_31905, partial [bacterium]|nr:hypothetical protein [bacterium]
MAEAPPAEAGALLPRPPRWGPGVEALAERIVAKERQAEKAPLDPDKKAAKRLRQKIKKADTKRAAILASGGGSPALDEKTVRWKDWEMVSTAAASTQGHSATTSASGSCDGSVRAGLEAEVAATASGPRGAAGNQEKKGAAEYLERIRQ